MFRILAFGALLLAVAACSEEPIVEVVTDQSNISHDAASMRLTSGDVYRFSDQFDQSQRRWLSVLPRSRGWSYAEDWGVWMDGNTASIVFYVPNYLPQECELGIAGGAFVNAKNPNMSVTFRLADEAPKTIALSHPSNFQYLVNLPLDPSVYQGQDVEVRIAVDSAAVPRDLGVNPDLRTLGISVTSVRLRGC